MPLVQWTPALSVNVKEIDAQHQMLISHLNELYDAMMQGKGNEVLTPLLGKLVAYTQTHFATEEKYMLKWNYPLYVPHKREHEDFVKKVAEFQANYQSGKAALTIDVLNFLKGWVSNHIQGSDKKYGPFFNQHGLY